MNCPVHVLCSGAPTKLGQINPEIDTDNRVHWGSLRLHKGQGLCTTSQVRNFTRPSAATKSIPSRNSMQLPQSSGPHGSMYLCSLAHQTTPQKTAGVASGSGAMVSFVISGLIDGPSESLPEDSLSPPSNTPQSGHRCVISGLGSSYGVPADSRYLVVSRSRNSSQC